MMTHIRLLIEHLSNLEDKGTNYHVENGANAIIQAERPQLVSGCVMPTMNGFGFAEPSARLDDGKYFIVLLTASQVYDRQTGEEAGADVC
jgi:DNA-binding response OmpR family regulator